MVVLVQEAMEQGLVLEVVMALEVLKPDMVKVLVDMVAMVLVQAVAAQEVRRVERYQKVLSPIYAGPHHRLIYLSIHFLLLNDNGRSI